MNIATCSIDGCNGPADHSFGSFPMHDSNAETISLGRADAQPNWLALVAACPDLDNEEFRSVEIVDFVGEAVESVEYFECDRHYNGDA